MSIFDIIMRNRSKRFRMPTGEWSKIVRFNQQDYLLKSLYDDDFEAPVEQDINPESPLSPTGTVLDELPWNRPVKKKPSRVCEDFMDDFMDDLGLTADTEEQKQEILQQRVDDELASSMEYIFRSTTGEDYTLRMSQDRFRNVIMFLVNSMTVISSSSTGETVDDFVYASGRMNGLFAYRMNVVDVLVKGGCPFFVLSDINHKSGRGGYISVHFTEERDAVISISYPGIAYKRPHTLITMEYETFCNMLPVDRITGTRKNPQEYYKWLMNSLLDKFQTIDAGLTLLKYNKNSRQTINMGGCIEDASFIKENFQPVAKYSAKSQSDRGILMSAMSQDIPQAETFYQESYAGCGPVQKYNENYVMIGGSETYYERLMNSVWVGSTGTAISNQDFIRFRFYTKHPEISTKRVEHNAILIPLVNFITVLPTLMLQMLG